MKKNKNILYIPLFSVYLLIFFSSSTLAVQWEKTFESGDYGYSLDLTSDNGYIITGVTGSYGDYPFDVCLIKTDSEGNEEWNKTFGGSGDDRGYSVQQTADGGYIIGGRTESFGAGEVDCWLIKTDSEGNELWNKTFGGTETDFCNEVKQTTDEGYILVGGTQSFGAGNQDIWLIKTDSEGNEVWNHTYGNEGTDIAGDVIQVENDCYIITGYLYTEGMAGQICLIKTDSEGNEIWTKTYGEYPEFIGIGHCVRQKSDGGYIVTGTGSSVWDSDEVFLLSTDTDGNYLWHRTFNKQGYVSSDSNSLDITDDGGFFITAYTDCSATNYDFWLIKTNSVGDINWDVLIGGEDREEAYCGQQTADGGYITVGFTRSYGSDDVYLVYFNPDIPGVPLSRIEIIISTLILLLLPIFLIFQKKNNYRKHVI